jgi:hypothetical protein
MLSATSAILIVAILAVPSAALAAYAAGRRATRRMTVPWRPIFQLVDHRTRCLGQDRGRVQAELGELLRIPSWAWSELFAMRRPLDRRVARRGAARGIQ